MPEGPERADPRRRIHGPGAGLPRVGRRPSPPRLLDQFGDQRRPHQCGDRPAAEGGSRPCPAGHAGSHRGERGRPRSHSEEAEPPANSNTASTPEPVEERAPVPTPAVVQHPGRPDRRTEHPHQIQQQAPRLGDRDPDRRSHPPCRRRITRDTGLVEGWPTTPISKSGSMTITSSSARERHVRVRVGQRVR